MKDAMLFLLPLAIVILLAMPLIPVYRGIKTGKKAKHAIVFNLCAFAGVCLAAIALPLTGLAADATAVAGDGGAGMGYLGAALSTGLASICLLYTSIPLQQLWNIFLSIIQKSKVRTASDVMKGTYNKINRTPNFVQKRIC